MSWGIDLPHVSGEIEHRIRLLMCHMNMRAGNAHANSGRINSFYQHLVETTVTNRTRLEYYSVLYQVNLPHVFLP